jgi:hypothetical protein
MLEEIVMSSPNERPTPRSSAALQRTTGRDRAEWFEVLDAWGAGGQPYREIADYLKREHGLSNWWAQKLIVEYEEAHGLRDPGVRRDGTFEVSASKTVEADPEAIFDAVRSPASQERWLPGIQPDNLEQVKDRIRFAWTDGASRVTVTVSPMGGGRTQVVVAHDRLRDGGDAANLKTYWRQRLSALKELLER